MAAPVLSFVEQKSSLSGKKKKKKVVKNVLGLPTSLKVESQVIESNEAKKLCDILERLLPLARLPVQQSWNLKKEKIVNEVPLEEAGKIEEAKNKRNQLSLGVNALNRSIKKELISAALLASDIQPKFLIHHLNLLCNHNNVPYLHLPCLREITRNCLGFPCIAVGFKKNCDFSEAVEEIKSIFGAKKADSIKNNAVESSESDDEIEQDDFPVERETKDSEIPFTYLYRSSTKQRMFVPEDYKSEKLPKPSEKDFISIQKEDETETGDEELSESGISSTLIRKQKKKLLSINDLDHAGSDEEDLEVPKKKRKKDWLIDKVGTKPKFKYSPANLVRVHSNPDRISKKCKKV